MKVLLIAYACEPHQGSEQGTGWNLALRLAEEHEVTVITRANNRQSIESDPTRAASPALSFFYHDPPDGLRALKRRGALSIQAYYALWQWTVGSRLKRDPALTDFDIVHHLTFNTFEVPPRVFGSARQVGCWGPLGGGQTAPASLLQTLSPHDRRAERLRSRRVAFSARMPWVRRACAACDHVWFANAETARRLAPFCKGSTAQMVDVGVDPARFVPAVREGDGNAILFAGKFEPRKGSRLLLMAFRHALRQNPALRLRMVGDGPLLEQEKQWSLREGLGAQVHFPGRQSHSGMVDELHAADLFAFPSLRDTSGAIVLEAMACGLPTICLDHQGAVLMVDGQSGFRVPVESADSTAAAFGDALVKFSRDAGLRRLFGQHARQRAIEQFSWKSKAAQISAVYMDVVARHKRENR